MGAPSMNKITDQIFLGNFDAAGRKKMLEENRISHIVCIGEEIAFPGVLYLLNTSVLSRNINIYNYHSLINLLYILHNISTKQISDIIYLNIRFINDALKTKTNNVLVHCTGGISRSPSIVIAYLIYKRKMTFKKAFELVKEKRPQINPNVGFQKNLVAYEKSFSVYLL